MDSKDRDESKMRRREETLARRVGEALDQMSPRGAGECPDAEIIAAYAEQALGPDESAKWEGHFAACARCRKILRVLAASADAPLAEKEVAQLGELVSAARAPLDVSGRTAWRAHPRFVDWRTRWLAPALGVAAVLVVWFAVRAPWRSVTDRGASQRLIAQAPKDEVPLSPVPSAEDRHSTPMPQQDQQRQAAPWSDGSSANVHVPVQAPVERSGEAGSALKKVSPDADVAKGRLQKEEYSASRSDGNGARSLAPSAPPPPQRPQAKAALGAPAPTPSRQTSAQANAAGPPAPDALASTSQSVTVTGSVPTVQTNGTLAGAIQQSPSADRPLNGRNFQALAPVRPAREYSALLKAPIGSSVWRAGNAGSIERSTDAGKTWASEISPSQEDWLAGAAVSETVCWLVGRDGAIARTVDGEHWEPIAPPAQAAVAGKWADWTGITARDAQSATITAIGGRKFATVDGGKSWQLQ
jgi:hypothetical protein